jgi:hypothetical protein
MGRRRHVGDGQRPRKPAVNRRADRIGARLHVMSRASAGTEIELSIPGNIVFQNGKVK